MSFHRRTSLLVSVALAAALQAGCGGAAAPTTATHTTAAPTPRFSSAPVLERRVGTTFRDALYRLAVMSQTGDAAADLGQPLPAGLLDAARCRPLTPAPRGTHWQFGCSVRWETPGGHRERTAYAVSTTNRGCWEAHARPALPLIHDATTRAPAEHPLDHLVGAIKGCP